MIKNNNPHKYKASENDILLSSRDEVKIINIALTQKTSRNIDIISKHFDSAIFNTADFIEAIKKLSISNKFSKIRILIKDSEPMTKHGHRIIELIQHLTSSIEVRKISEEYNSLAETFSLYDGKGVIYLYQADRYNGFANFNRPRLVAELTKLFSEVWEHSETDVNLRRLSI